MGRKPRGSLSRGRRWPAQTSWNLSPVPLRSDGSPHLPLTTGSRTQHTAVLEVLAITYFIPATPRGRVSKFLELFIV